MRKNENIIYGVDATKDVTPILVRDAIIQCYYEAHCEILEHARDTFGKPPREKFEKMKKEHVKELVENIICTNGGDYKNPDKNCLLKLIKQLEKIASIYREPEIIEKHVSEINILMNKL